MSSFPFVSCLSTATIRDARVATKIAAAAAAGFEAIELSLDELQEIALSRGVSGLASQIRGHGIGVANVVGLPSWTGYPEGGAPVVFDRLRRALDLVVELGSPLVSCTPAGVPASSQYVRRDFEKLAREAERRGLAVALEALAWDPAISTVFDAIDVVGVVRPAIGKIVVDSAHLSSVGTRPEELRNLASTAIGMVHINDAIRLKGEVIMDSHRVLPGDGNLPLGELLVAVHELGYRGAISLELFNRELWSQDPFEVARAGLARCIGAWTRTGR